MSGLSNARWLKASDFNPLAGWYQGRCSLEKPNETWHLSFYWMNSKSSSPSFIKCNVSQRFKLRFNIEVTLNNWKHATCCSCCSCRIPQSTKFLLLPVFLGEVRSTTCCMQLRNWMYQRKNCILKEWNYILRNTTNISYNSIHRINIDVLNINKLGH